jgi:probable F420-dependent oxidoreductase
MYATSSGREWIALARRTEAAGFDVLTLSDHIAGLVNREFSRFSPIPALSAAAAVTERIRFSMFVLCNDFRHPVALAKEMSTLDVLSDGRVEVGIGAGWDRYEYAEMGIEYSSGAKRVTRLYESVAIMRQLWDSGAPVHFDGATYQVHDLELWPKPIQPKIPIMIGGGGPVILRKAAKVADIISLMKFTGGGLHDAKRGGAGATLDAVREQLKWITESAGPRIDEITVNYRANVFCLTEDRDSAARAILSKSGFDDPDDLLSSPYALIGTHRQMADQIERQRDELGLSYVAVNQPDLDDFAPVIELLAGR